MFMRIALGSFATLASAAADWDPLEVSDGFKNGCEAIKDMAYCDAGFGVALACFQSGGSCALNVGNKAWYDSVRSDDADLAKAGVTTFKLGLDAGGWVQAACTMWNTQLDEAKKEAGCKGESGGSYNKCRGTTECYGADKPDGCVTCLDVANLTGACTEDKMGAWTYDTNINPAICEYDSTTKLCVYKGFGTEVANWCADNASSATRTAAAFSVFAAAVAALAM
jgi:hypothetical protein